MRLLPWWRCARCKARLWFWRRSCRSCLDELAKAIDAEARRAAIEMWERFMALMDGVSRDDVERAIEQDKAAERELN